MTCLGCRVPFLSPLLDRECQNTVTAARGALLQYGGNRDRIYITLRRMIQGAVITLDVC